MVWIPQKQIWTRQPSPHAARIDWTHPIAAKFCAFSLPLAGGLSRNFSNGKLVETHGVSSGAGTKVAPGLGGLGVDGSAITTQSHRLHSVANATDTAWEEPRTAATWFAVAARRGNNPNGNAPLFMNGSPTVSPYSAYAIVDGNGNGTSRLQCAVGGVLFTIDIGSIQNSRLTVIVGRYTGSRLEGFFNGIKHATYQSCSGNLSYVNDASRGPCVGNFYDYTVTARSFNGQVYLVGVAPVALSDAEIAALSANPWQIFAP